MSMNELERLSVIQKIVDKHLTQVLAAKQLGVTDRQVRRLVKDYKLYGLFCASVGGGTRAG